MFVKPTLKTLTLQLWELKAKDMGCVGQETLKAISSLLFACIPPPLGLSPGIQTPSRGPSPLPSALWG